MTSPRPKPSPSNDARARRKRLEGAIRLQEIEGNPLDAEQMAMFEMFEREGWSDERRLKYVLERARRRAAGPNAAE
jgi:hypothetical protein